MYNNDAIQEMIDKTNSNEELKSKVISNVKDAGIIAYVLSKKYVDYFDNYDSDVCEQFIRAYLKAEGK